MKIFNVGNRIVNTFVYKIDTGYVMIDTGYDNYLNRVLKKMKKNNISPLDIKYIFLTHAHDDHAGFLNEFISKYPNVKVICADCSKGVLKKGQNPFDGGCSSLLSFFFCNLMKLFGRGEHKFPIVEDKNFSNFLWVNDSTKGKLEKLLNGQIIYTPGHTDDSISLLVDGILFCGDSAMNGFPSLHKVTIWVGDKNRFFDSWKKIISLKPTRIFPAHGKSFDYSCLEKNLNKLEKVKLYSIK